MITVTKEDGLYRADIEGLPDCTEWADTEAEVIALAEDSIAATREIFAERSPV